MAIPLQGELTFDELAYRINHSQAAVLWPTILSPRWSSLSSTSCRTCGRWWLAELAAHEPAGSVELPGTPTGTHRWCCTPPSARDGRRASYSGRVFPSAGRSFVEHFGLREDDNYFLPLTMAHAIGALVAPAIATWVGAALSVVPTFGPSAFWTQVADTAATVSITFPAHLNLLMETADGAPAASESTLRLLITQLRLQAFRQRFGVELPTVWGMTETGALCSGSEPGYRGQWEGYVGTPMRGVDTGVFDEKFERLEPGEVGEIALHHDQVMLGYLDDPDATNATLVDGWVRLGDYGEVDAEGRLFFRGRLKNMIKRSGENVSPEEVENILAEHPDVVECFVFGVPDQLRTEEVAAVVVTRAPVAPDALFDFAAERLSRLKLPRYLQLSRESLARLGNGKIDRPRIKRSFDAGTAWDRQGATAR